MKKWNGICEERSGLGNFASKISIDSKVNIGIINGTGKIYLLSKRRQMPEKPHTITHPMQMRKSCIGCFILRIIFI